VNLNGHVLLRKTKPDRFLNARLNEAAEAADAAREHFGEVVTCQKHVFGPESIQLTDLPTIRPVSDLLQKRGYKPANMLEQCYTLLCF